MPVTAFGAPKPDTWNSNINMFVPNCQYSADIDAQIGDFRIDMGALAALSAAGIQSAISIAAVATFTPLTTFSKSVMGPFGRNVSMVASGAATSTVRINGRDYLGQPMSEDFTLNGAVTVNGKKAFKDVQTIQILTTTAATTINVGWGNSIGLPYRTVVVQSWLEDGLSATAGTLTNPASATAAQNATSADPRGTAAFNGTPNGTKTFSVVGVADLTNLFGAAHFSA